MLRTLRHSELGHELIRFQNGLALTTKAGLRVGQLLSQALVKTTRFVLALCLEHPRLYRRIAPGKREEVTGERQRAVPLLSHPPPGWYF